MNIDMEDIVQLVMTVPDQHNARLVYQFGCRTTLGVLVQLIAQAQHRIIISAPYIQTNHDNINNIIFDALRSALLRGVSVDFLSTKSCLESIKRDQLLPDTYSRLRLFQSSANINNDQMLGSHAKFCVADGNSAYVGSANLTGPGLDSQFELGLLTHGQAAYQIEQFWDYAINLGLFVGIT